MQTILRLDDTIYREAKAEAARRGLTITRFIENALRTQLDRPEETATNGGRKWRSETH